MAQKGIEYTPTDADRKKVKDYAAVGIPQEDIAFALGVCKNTLRKHYEKELRLGMIEASATVGGNLFRMTKTHPAAAIFWKKTRDRWKEEAPEIKPDQERPLVFTRGKTRKSQESEESEEPKNGTTDN